MDEDHGNVENHDKDYPQGDLQGFSGLPYGPRPDVSPVIRKKKRVVNGGGANYGEWPWQVLIYKTQTPPKIGYFRRY